MFTEHNTSEGGLEENFPKETKECYHILTKIRNCERLDLENLGLPNLIEKGSRLE